MRDESKKKRVLRACDTCRIKKAKCDGSKPCLRCQTDNQVCTYAHRRKHSERVFTQDYVELLESKLHTVLKSFMFIVQELGEGRDCSSFVEGPEPSVASVIERVSDHVKSSPQIEQKVAQLLESSKFGVESDSEPETQKPETPRPKPRRGRPPKHTTQHKPHSPIARPPPRTIPSDAHDEHPKPDALSLEPLTPPAVPLRNDELDKTKNSLIMQWQNPSSESFDLYRSAPFDETYIPQEPLYADSFVLNDEFTSPSQPPEFDHPFEYDLPMEDFCEYNDPRVKVEM